MGPFAPKAESGMGFLAPQKPKQPGAESTAMSHATLVPKDHAEEVALFRSEIVGALSRKDLAHGELAESFRELSQERFRPPRADKTKTFSVPTLERWYYRYREGRLDALPSK